MQRDRRIVALDGALIWLRPARLVKVKGLRMRLPVISNALPVIPKGAPCYFQHSPCSANNRENGMRDFENKRQFFAENG
jgi:hypothetical protein